MRKLPIGPLLVIIVLFLASHFANAQALPQSLPEKLPAKLPSKLPQKTSNKRAAVRGAKAVATQSAKLPAKLPSKTPAKSNMKVATGLPKKLPSFKSKRVQINFEEIPSTPLEQSVVVMAPALEAPQDANAIAAASIEQLPQALPVKPPQAPAAPELAYVERPLIEVLPSEPTNELWQLDPNAVAAQPLTEAGVRLPQPPQDDVEVIQSATAGLTSDPLSIFNPAAETTSGTTSSASATTQITQTPVETAPTAIAVETSTTVEVTQSAQAVVQAAPAPVVIENANLSARPTEISASTNSLSAKIDTREDNSSPNKLFIRAGYLSAQYS
ncbi:MAG: hypothetical protein EOP05_20080, partial [Proteobacteria bacterium]